MSSLAGRTGRPLTVISVILMSGFVLSGCTTTEQYTRQICLNKGIASDTSAFDDYVVEQKSLIGFWDSRFEAYRAQNT